VEVAASAAFQYPFGWADLGLGRLENGVSFWFGPGGECGAGVFEVGVFGRDHQVLPFGQPVGEFAVLGGQVPCLLC
jgi:hypothetical protein